MCNLISGNFTEKKVVELKLMLLKSKNSSQPKVVKLCNETWPLTIPQQYYK